jgi:hypothetical protein
VASAGIEIIGFAVTAVGASWNAQAFATSAVTVWINARDITSQEMRSRWRTERMLGRRVGIGRYI